VRRCLHAFLVGVLLLSLSMNAARACFYLRHGCHARHHVVVAYPPVMAAYPVVIHAPVVEVVDTWGDGCGDVSTGWRVVADGVVEAPLVADECSCDCGGTVVEESFEFHAETLVEEHVSGATIVEDVIYHGQSVAHPQAVTEAVAAAEPTLAEPVMEKAETVVEKTAPTPAAVPDLESTEEVRQAVAFAEPAPKPEPDVVLPADPMPAPEAAAEPAAPPAVESNIFEEVDQAAGGAAAGGVEDVLHEPAASAAPATEEPSAAEATGSEFPGGAPEEAPAEPSAPADPFSATRPASREPARRWIDRSGDYAVVGTLRAVRGDGSCELEAEGRTIEVPLEALSAFDRAYVTAASGRLAVRSEPVSGDTAGL
jgi:hypothetical protein